jgi:acyl carrier protein
MFDEQFEKILRGYLPFLSPADGLADSARLRDLGLDSMGTVELIAELERHYSIRFLDDLLSLDNFATPGSIWTLICEIGAMTQ